MGLYLPSDSVTGRLIDVDLLADYLELTAFFADDSTARGSDLVNAASLAAEDRDGVDGEIRHGPQTLVERGANRIRQRRISLGSAYPFELGPRGEMVTCRVDDAALGPAAYVLSLVLSHLRSVSPVLDGSKLHPGDEEVRRLRQYFQGCATAALAAEVQGAAWSFGFPRPDGSGFLEKLEQIWRKLRDGTVARQAGAPDRPKDDHIDVFAARTHPDGLPGFLLAVAQVATGANWRQKSLIGHQTGFKRSWFSAPPVTDFIPYIVVPFAADDKRFVDDVGRMGNVLHRLRVPRRVTEAAELAEAGVTIEGYDGLPEIAGWVTAYRNRARAA